MDSSTLTTEALTRAVVLSAETCREAQQAYLRARKAAGQADYYLLNQARDAERHLDRLLAEWRAREEGRGGQQAALFG